LQGLPARSCLSKKFSIPAGTKRRDREMLHTRTGPDIAKMLF
jgi:hypothetical protein